MVGTSLMKFLPGECLWTSLMISQHWFRWWLGAVRQQAITWANVDRDLCRQMASLDLNELNLEFYKRVATVIMTFAIVSSFHSTIVPTLTQMRHGDAHMRLWNRPEVRKLLLFNFLLFLDLKLENYYFFTFLLFLDLKLENYSVFTFLLFLDLKLENYSALFHFFLNLKLENYSIFRWRSARLQ